MSRYDLLKGTIDRMSLAMNASMEYELAWTWAERINESTQYKGKGRPRKTDYVVYKHPFDGALKKIICTFNYQPTH